jgi:hypothetical protein
VNLVVSDDVRQKLNDFAPIKFSKVKFTNLIDFPIPEAGILAIKDPGVRIDPFDARNILRTRADVSEHHRSIGKRYEVLTARVAYIRARYRNVKTMQVRVGKTAQGSEMVEVDLSREMCRDFAVLCDGPWIFRDDAFAAVEGVFDWDFFMTTEITL